MWPGFACSPEVYATLREQPCVREEQYPYEKTTPVGFEPTRGDPIGLAGRRLNRSAKVSLVRSATKSICLVLPAMDASGVGYVFPTDFEAVVQRSSMRAAQHGAIDPPRNPPFPQPLFFEPF